MEMLLERLSPGQIVAVISVVCGCVVGLAMIVAITKYQFQALADYTALKREKLLANIAYRKELLERGQTPPASLDELLTPDAEEEEEEDEEEGEYGEAQLDAELAKRFGMLDLSSSDIEATLARAMAVEPARKSAIIGVMDELLENDAAHAAILAAVRPLCGGSEAEATSGRECRFS
jgi:hypothetical protein